MRFRQTGSLGAQANAAVSGLAARADGRTAEVADRAARAIVVAVRLLRIPTAVVGAAPLPFIAATLVLGVLAKGSVGVAIVVVGVAMALVSALFWGRRHRVLRAVADPERLASELAILVSLSGRVEESRGALAEIAGGGGWRVLSRLRGVWKGTQMTGRWIDGIGDLEHARYFAPPKIGTNVTITVLALWLIPISVVVTLIAVVGTIAGSI
ncbi:hypothetical protein [Aeromicrobium chenweiae]|uniref:Uncharacterized protein n=1 Tax=Aeromicrobium chenweiae TaxID=2079793 RepID=A0A2S0WIE6_9ACTN|nr:hypothetical protein [Aeromicrobium chenweiae]AWB91062.1 hypothetical protein C3E78_01840 [Aeromicrobium chenweiae]TGN31965.1 hypothetical protein E4L97_11350 [Aeromicrobium chenweiae]